MSNDKVADILDRQAIQQKQDEEITLCQAEIGKAVAEGDKARAATWCNRLQRALWYTPEEKRKTEQIVIEWDHEKGTINVDGTCVHNLFLFNAVMGMAHDLVAVNLVKPEKIRETQSQNGETRH
jgi:hypothetical protein